MYDYLQVQEGLAMDRWTWVPLRMGATKGGSGLFRQHLYRSFVRQLLQGDGDELFCRRLSCCCALFFQWCAIAIATCILIGCNSDQQRGPSQASAALAAIAEHSGQIDKVVFGKMPVERVNEFSTALQGLGYAVDSDRSRLFVPALDAYPGWFDMGLAAQFAMLPDSFTMEHGMIRIFVGNDDAFIMVLSRREMKVDNRVLSAPQILNQSF